MDRTPQNRASQPPQGRPPYNQPPQTGPVAPPNTGQQMPPAQYNQQMPPMNPGQAIPAQQWDPRRAALMAGFNATEQNNPSPLLASVIAHREETVRRNTSRLQALEPPPEAEPEPKQPEKKAPRPKGPSPLSGIFRRLSRKRVPVLIQMSEVECGAACLAMILRYYGRKSSISEVSERSSVGRDGLTALSIVKTARDYGMRVRSVSLKENDFRYVTLPAIVHWQFNHFIIVERWSPKIVEVVDPAGGRKSLPADEFDAGFTGVVIMMEPGTQFVRNTSAPQMTLGTYITQYVRRAPGVLVQIILGSLLLQLFGLAMPLLTKIVIDQVIPLKAGDILPLLGIGVIVMVLAQLVTMLLRAALLIYLQARIDTQIMPNFFEHLLTLPTSFFQKRSSGDIMARLSSNVTVRDIISNQLVSTFLDGSLVIVYLIILLTQAWDFGAFVIVIGLLQIALLLGTQRVSHELNRQELEATGKTQGYVAEVLGGIYTLKAAGAEQRTFARWVNLFFSQLNTSMRQNYLSSVVSTFMFTLQTLSPLALLWIGAIQVLNGSMQVGTMLALNALAVAFLSPLASLVSSGQQLQVVHAHLERIADVLDAQPEQDVQRVQQPPALSGRIYLEHISFSYDANSPRILKDISLHIEPGQKIAIVGRTGSGKSTLGRLALGLCLPTEGEIYYDGIPLRFLNYQAVRAQFGVVMQDAAVFSGSIRENIAFNAPDIGMERITRAAQMAVIHDDILQMPMGYETYVSEGGSVLSGGQRQRLAIARALAHAPAILLMDEATSALDVITEQKVEQNLRTLGCTQMIIAHRLSTVRNADRILVIEEGMLVEHGTHEQLIKQNKYYARLIRSQVATGDMKAD